MVRVAITHNESIEPAIHEALDHLEVGGLIANKYVAVKPNET